MDPVRHKLQSPMDEKLEQLICAIGLLGLLQDPANQGKSLEELASLSAKFQGLVKQALRDEQAAKIAARKKSF